MILVLHWKEWIKSSLTGTGLEFVRIPFHLLLS